MKSDFLIALTQLAAERHLPREQVLQAIEAALASAFKKDNPASGQNISVKLNPNTGDVNVYALKTVVETVQDPTREIGLKDAQAIRATAALGEEVAATEPLPHNASRIAAQTAKQVVLQRLREAERELLYQEFLKHQDDIISGVVEQIESGRTIVLDLGRAQAILPPEEQVPFGLIIDEKERGGAWTLHERQIHVQVGREAREVEDVFRVRNQGRVQAAIGEEVSLILLSAPGAMSYYPKIGFAKVENGFIVKRAR